MARPKKNGKYVNFYMDANLFKSLENFSKDSGMTKTMIMERALKEYIVANEKFTYRNKKQQKK